MDAIIAAALLYIALLLTWVAARKPARRAAAPAPLPVPAPVLAPLPPPAPVTPAPLPPASPPALALDPEHIEQVRAFVMEHHAGTDADLKDLVTAQKMTQLITKAGGAVTVEEVTEALNALKP